MAYIDATLVYVRLSRVGLSRVDRTTARFLQGANHYLMFALACAVPFLASFLVLDAAALWPAALVHAALISAWSGCFALNAVGWHRTSSVLGLLAPLAAYTAQTWLFSATAGFLFPMLATAAVSFVTIAPGLAVWRWILTALASAGVAWSFLDTSVTKPLLDVSLNAQRGLLIANVALATFIVGTTAWLNDFYFTRERRRAESRLTVAEQQARTDALTQLANRRGMVEALAAVPQDKPYAIAIADLDRFKSVNDKLGHAEGDKVLAEVARVLTDALGPSAVVSRWGGEEFLVLLPEARLTSAVATLERARKAVEAVVVAGGEHAVTMSAGLAAASGGLPWEIAVRVADALLYDAKEAGRNRVRYAQVRADASEWEA